MIAGSLVPTVRMGVSIPQPPVDDEIKEDRKSIDVVFGPGGWGVRRESNLVQRFLIDPNIVSTGSEMSI